jgi:hypothetical protein
VTALPPVLRGIASELRGAWRWREWSIKQRIKAIDEAALADGASLRMRDLLRSAAAALDRGDYDTAEATLERCEREITARRP